jgi:hypothetical protein
MKRPPTASRPSASGLFTSLKSTPHSAWAAARRKMARPKVAKTWASMGAPRIQRIRPWYTAKPRRKRRATVMGSEVRGSRRASAHAQKVANMASMRNSPWAKLTISMRPKMRESPAAMRA